MLAPQPQPETLDRRDGPYGEVALRRRGDRYEIIANGCFLMDTSDGRSERLLVSAALDALPHHAQEEADGRPERLPVSAALDALPHHAPEEADGRPEQLPVSAALDALPHHAPEEAGPARCGPHLLIGGLGVGFSLAEAAADPRPGRITVLEREQAVLDWHTVAPAPLARFAGSGHTDPRVRLVKDDLLHHLRTTGDRYHALCLDIDNGPDWTVTDTNGGLYGFAGLTVLERVLAPGGVLAVWSAAPAPEFEERLRARFQQVERLNVAVEVERGDPDVVYLASHLP
jgi:PAS domain-containing protein